MTPRATAAMAPRNRGRREIPIKILRNYALPRFICLTRTVRAISNAVDLSYWDNAIPALECDIFTQSVLARRQPKVAVIHNVSWWCWGGLTDPRRQAVDRRDDKEEVIMDWIERWFGVSPDGGDGSTEAL